MFLAPLVPAGTLLCATCLVQALAKTETLTRLGLRGNQITEEIAFALLKARRCLRNESVLTCVDDAFWHQQRASDFEDSATIC